MKAYLQYLVLGIMMFILLLPERQTYTPELFLSNPPDFSHLNRNTCPEAYSGDTIVNLSIFNFSAYTEKVDEREKEELIETAIRLTIPDDRVYKYLSVDYWKRDTANYDFEAVNCKRCAYEDFYFSDLDNDGDLDIIYSSLLNDYLNDDSNELLLFKNNNGKYKLHRISGFAQHANFKFHRKGYIIFSMVSSPCCEEMCYHFSIDTFNVKKWTSTSGKVIAISNSKVKLLYPAKDIL